MRLSCGPGIDTHALTTIGGADTARLATFLKEAAPEGPSKLRIAFEFRHASWFADETFDLLRQHQAALCVAESDELQTPDVVTAPFCCYRLRKSDYGEADLPLIENQFCPLFSDA